MFTTGIFHIVSDKKSPSIGYLNAALWYIVRLSWLGIRSG